MDDAYTIMWFRNDLRINDNPALFAAAKTGKVIPVYIEDSSISRPAIGASKTWLQLALQALNQQLSGHLQFCSGNAIEILTTICQQLPIKNVYFGRRYQKDEIEQDKEVITALSKLNIACESFNHSLLWEPGEVTKADGSPYKVFTPFYRKGCLSAQPPRHISPEITHIEYYEGPIPGVQLSKSEYKRVAWEKKICQYWDVTEQGAQERLTDFIKNGLQYYKIGRDFPAQRFVSKLSPYLRFGLISPHQIWHNLPESITDEKGKDADPNLDHFKSELAWREFSYHLLFENNNLPNAPLQKKFENFDWLENEEYLKKWSAGQTGYPIIDAGMHELWETGYMHNRVRMIVASFLVKNLRIHWKEGEKWFWECLVDADLANNSASWQWVAGSGADAAPYFRIFNPITQSKKFDPDGEYIKTYLPHLKQLPTKFIHEPWLLSPLEARSINFDLEKHYHHPIVDLKHTREAALTAFKQL